MKKVLIAAIAAITVSSNTHAATLAINDAVSVANQANGPHSGEGAVVRLFTTASNAQTQVAMPNGNRFRFGFFLNLDTSADGIAALGTKTVAELTTGPNRFVPLGEGASNDGRGGGNLANLVTSTFGGVAGRLNKSFTGFTWGGDGTAGNTDVAGGLQRGTRLFVMLFDSNSTAGDGSWGLFSGDNWVVPATIGTNTTFTIRLDDVDTAAEVMRGSLGSLHLAPQIPEPSVVVLGLLTGLGLDRKSVV